MSDFIAEIRGPRIPTSCVDFNSDPDDFVAELRPRSMRAAPALNADMGSNCCFDEMTGRTCPSDEELKGALAAKRFSMDQMTEMLQNSIFILIQKFLSGKSIATVSGNICVSFQDSREPPLCLDFSDSNTGDSFTAYPESLAWRHESRPPKLIRAEDISDSFDREGFSSPQEEITSLKYAADVPTSIPTLYTDRSPVDDSDTLYSLSVQPRMPCLWRRRDSDTESGYSSKCHDEMMDAESLHDVDVDGEPDQRNPQEIRSCPSVDSLESLTDAERLKLETSSGKNKDDNNKINGAEQANAVLEDDDDDDDDRLPALVIDENADDRYPKEESSKTTEHMEDNRKPEEAKPSLLPDHNLCMSNSQSGSSNFPVDLSGDSEHSKEGVSMQIRNSQSLVYHPQSSVSEQVVLVSKVSDPEYRSPLPAHEHSHRTYDDICGQLLDLSMKKKPSIEEEKTLGDLKATQRAVPSKKLGDNLPRDGYSLPGSDRLPLTVCDVANHQVDQRMEERVPRDVAYYNSQTFQPKVGATDNLLVVPNVPRIDGHNRPRSAEVPALDRPEVLLSRSRSMVPSMGSVRYSPYNRERLALLAARFLTSRKQQHSTYLSRPVNKPIRMPITDSGKTTDDAHRAPEFSINTFTSPPGAAFMNKAAAREASFSETTLKNRVSAFVRNGGHHTNTTCTPLPTNSNITFVDRKMDTSKENSSITKSSGSWKRIDGSFMCIHTECGQQFATFQGLERHSIDTHGRYLCEHCGKGFTARPNRDRHARYHTGERPYKCDLCPQAFFRGDDLKYHRTTRHPGAEPYVCTKCNRSFAWGRDLDRHLRQAKCKA